MRDTHHLLLLTLLGVPGCPERLDDESDDEGNSIDLGQACEQYYEHYYACADYEPEAPVPESCAESQPYFEGYADECQAALAEYWACLSEVDCATLVDPYASVETCPEVRRRGHDTCPLLFSYCDATVGSSGASPCAEGRAGCVDGKIYDLECTDLADGSMGCVCKIDGEPVSEFDVANRTCAEDHISAEMFDRCGFPDGV
jgi:hypothetical protein